MNLLGRILVLLSLSLLPVFATAMQSTPAPGSAEPLPFGNGVGSTATYLDQRGNPVLSITVTSIERAWDDYDRYSEPQGGMEYVAVYVTITNESGRPFIVVPYDFSLIDSLGMSVSSSWVSEGPNFLSDETTIDPGQSIETGLIFEIFTDVDPLLLMYEPDYNLHVVIYLGE